MESITLSDQAMSNCLCFIFFLTNTTAYSVSKILNYSVLPPSPSGHYPIVPSKTVLLPKFQQSLPFAKPSVSLPLSKPPFGLRKHCTALGRCKHTTPLLSMHLPQKRHASGLGFQAPQTSHASAAVVFPGSGSPPQLPSSLRTFLHYQFGQGTSKSLF